MKKSIFAIFIILFLTVGCDSKYKRQFVGEWSSPTLNEKLILLPNGTGTSDGSRIDWEISGNEFRIIHTFNDGFEDYRGKYSTSRYNIIEVTNKIIRLTLVETGHERIYNRVK